MNWPATTETGRPMAVGDAIDLVLDRAGVGVDVDAGGLGVVRHVLMVPLLEGGRTPCHWKCEGKHGLPGGFPGVRSCAGTAKNQGNTHDGPARNLRVAAYNTAKQSENKMHDDTVARRFGFSGGLVPGVDVMAYMMHLPVRRWGRDFLERGLIEARFVKPVYDGETADVTADENNGVLTIEVESRGDLCATGTASLPASAPVDSRWRTYPKCPRWRSARR